MKITLVQQSRTTAKGWKYRQVSPVMRPFILDSLVKSLMAATPGGRSFRMLHLSAQQDFLGCALGASSWHCGDSVRGFGPRNDPSRPRPRRHGAVPLPFAPATRAFVGSFPTVLWGSDRFRHDRLEGRGRVLATLGSAKRLRQLGQGARRQRPRHRQRRRVFRCRKRLPAGDRYSLAGQEHVLGLPHGTRS